MQSFSLFFDHSRESNSGAVISIDFICARMLESSLLVVVRPVRASVVRRGQLAWSCPPIDRLIRSVKEFWFPLLLHPSSLFKRIPTAFSEVCTPEDTPLARVWCTCPRQWSLRPRASGSVKRQPSQEFHPKLMWVRPAESFHVPELFLESSTDLLHLEPVTSTQSI